MLHRAITYCKMSLIFIILGGIVLFIAGKPLYQYALSYGSMLIADGAPGHVGEVEMIQPLVNPSDSANQNASSTPDLYTQYGTISCERIDLSAPLYYGDNNYSLQNGVGQYEGSGFPGEGRPILLGGHDKTFFEPLKNIAKGDVIIITTNHGQYKYQVTATKVAGKWTSSAYDLRQKKEQLIMYTCYPIGQLIGNRDKRLFVYCDPMSDNSVLEQ